MARHKNVNWDLPESASVGGGRKVSPPDVVYSALLMDIRDELVTLNRLLHCQRFQGIPDDLRAIRCNTTKKREPGKA